MRLAPASRRGAGVGDGSKTKKPPRNGAEAALVRGFEAISSDRQLTGRKGQESDEASKNDVENDEDHRMSVGFGLFEELSPFARTWIVFRFDP